jgi:hypothetical protein
MPARSCRVTIRDLDGVDHTVAVTASTLYEAVALGLASVRGHEWVAGIQDGLSVVKVAVTNIPVEHTVKLQDFNAWLATPGRSPREQTARARIRELLGMARQTHP